jgi:hypothetical protein
MDLLRGGAHPNDRQGSFDLHRFARVDQNGSGCHYRSQRLKFADYAVMVRCWPGWAFIHRLIGTATTLVLMAGRAVMMVVLVVVMVLVAGVNGWTLTGLAGGGLAAAMIVMVMPQRGHGIGKQIARQHQPTRKFLKTAHRRNLTNRRTRTSPTILRCHSLESNLPRQNLDRSHASLSKATPATLRGR